MNDRKVEQMGVGDPDRWLQGLSDPKTERPEDPDFLQGRILRKAVLREHRAAMVQLSDREVSRGHQGVIDRLIREGLLEASTERRWWPILPVQLAGLASAVFAVSLILAIWQPWSPSGGEEGVGTGLQTFGPSDSATVLESVMTVSTPDPEQESLALGRRLTELGVPFIASKADIGDAWLVSVRLEAVEDRQSFAQEMRARDIDVPLSGLLTVRFSIRPDDGS